MTSTTDISLQALDVKNDRDVLIELFNLTDGGNWKRSDNWGSTLPLKHWWGVNADDSDNVIGINLAKNNLSGKVYHCCRSFIHEGDSIICQVRFLKILVLCQA